MVLQSSRTCVKSRRDLGCAIWKNDRWCKQEANWQCISVTRNSVSSKVYLSSMDDRVDLGHEHYVGYLRRRGYAKYNRMAKSSEPCRANTGMAQIRLAPEFYLEDSIEDFKHKVNILRSHSAMTIILLLLNTYSIHTQILNTYSIPTQYILKVIVSDGPICWAHLELRKLTSLQLRTMWETFHSIILPPFFLKTLDANANALHLQSVHTWRSPSKDNRCWN